MPTSRSSKLLSKSRSPAVSAPSTPRQYLPPSHYAAAGGFVSPNSNSIGRKGGGNMQDDGSTRWTGYYRNQPPGTSDSDSSLSLPGQGQPQSFPGIPNLETQLLPSLRDTIDRMTGTPSRASTYYPGGTDTRKSSSRSRRNSPNSTLAPTPKASYSQIYSPRGDDTMMSANTYSEQSVSSTSRLKAPVKSALKTSLRSPKSIPPSPKPSIPASPSIAGSSLRNMKSLLSRKCSGTLKSPFNGNKAPRKKDEISEKPETQHTPRLSSKKSFQSNIPRPRTRYYNDDPTRTEDSDLERRYEDDLRNRRKLTVANAAVSLSSSDSDTESRIERYDVNYAGDRSAVGLGLSFAQNIPPRTTRQADVRSNTPEKTLRFSLPNSESASSYYSDEFNNYQPPRNHGNTEIESSNRVQKRTSFPSRSDHYQVTTEPTLEHRFKNSTPRRPSPQQKRRSRSPTYAPSDLSMEETESEREGYSIRHSKVKESRRRSSSCEPRFLPLEADTSDSGVPIVSHRPRSACHHDRQPSPTSERVFPANLRDLIKSRNSFSKLPSIAGKDATTSLPISSSRHREAQPSRAKTPTPPTPSRAYNNDSLRSRLSKRNKLTEASAIVDGYRFAAARERQAFGIPPSESDEVLKKAANEVGFAYTDSETSSLDRRMWQEDESEELSAEAESILKGVDYNDMRRKDTQRNDQRMYTKTPRLSVISPTISAPSVYDEQVPQTNWKDENRDQYPYGNNSARDPEPCFHDTLRTREGVIQEIFETEEELLRLFRICMQVFILPLRARNSRSWIIGVPRNVSKLLDWFDDIVNLHEQIYESLCLARDTMSPATDRVSESLRCFVLKAEVYQPYLVRLSDVSQEIAALTKNPKDDLGQFINIQQRTAESEGWTLDRLLVLPVNRLAEYQDLFARMLDLTPKDHQDYLSTFSLSRSADMVIRVMTEVKIREDEYNLLKAFSSRIQGLPSHNELATRQRRLLHSGVLSLVLSGIVSSDDGHNGSGARQQEREAKRTKRVSKMLDAISASSSVAFDMSDLTKSASNGDGSFGAQTPAASTPAKSPSTSWFSRLPLRKRSAQKSPMSTPVSSSDPVECLHHSPSPLITVSVHAFIFNDLVLLAQPSQTLGKEPRWILSKDLGPFRPLSIAHIQSERKEGIIISLESMTLDLDQINETADFRTSYRTVDLVLPRTRNDNTLETTSTTGEPSSDAWLLSFRKCCKTTLRKLTFPGGDNSDDFFTSSDRMLDTRVAVSSLVASGLPIPRSPSGTYPDMRGGADSSFAGDEREERGWWSLRYQQVFREFQRQDSVLSDDEDSNNL